MRWRTAAGVATALAALAVAAALLAAERDRDDCVAATDAAFSAAQAPLARLGPAVDRVIADCSGSEPLTRVALGLVTVGRPAQARRLARVAAEREPESFYAWLVLARTETGSARERAALRARELNPLSARAVGP